LITHETIQTIVDACQIEDVVGDFVRLRRRGTNLTGLCPFHDERTPSFSVSPAKGIYKCFGCGAGGNSINFVMEHEKLSYPETLRYLAQKYNIEIQETHPANRDEAEAAKSERDTLFILNEFAQKYFAETLHKHTEGKSIGLSYFKERGISDGMIEQFGLGYAIEAWENFANHATQQGFKQIYLEKTGLCVKTEKGKFFDRFHGRVMFPIHNLAGKIAGFGARTLSNQKKEAKYLNSPQSEIYDKSHTLYGIYQAKKSILAQDQCVLVEGYLDVISLHQIGIAHTVASSGTSLTAEQAKLIRRFTPNVLVVYDGDPAGIKASVRSIDILLENDMNVRVCLLPNGDDPDSYSRKLGAAAFKDFLADSAEDFISFKTHLLLNDAGNDPIKRAVVIKDVIQSVAKINDAIKRALFATQISKQMNIDENIVLQEIQRIKVGKFNQNNASNQSQIPDKMPLTAPVSAVQTDTSAQYLYDAAQETDIIYLLMRHAYKTMTQFEATVAEVLTTELKNADWETPTFKMIFDLYATAQSASTQINIRTDLIHNPNYNVAQAAAELCQDPEVLSANWGKKDVLVKNADDNYETEVISALLRLLQKKIEGKIRINKQKIKTAQTDEATDEYLKIQRNLDGEKIEIAARLGSVIVR
jgi:DNA primase